ncbi:MAG TPA: FliM/FliN family flagellar motor switch protein [Candidatus Cloacimonadota bacterium]|nr:FliM/FliN family flagellar motor switch protein [Candidatus Cloacimonadota bacterium]HOQ80259.1 FliM/FliN family flagellar motor switch protein [Candidatus Cloacimonadota bacterium]HPK41363.1 FliM/FliN family flagellar motor switch protein [Candidatus Cloacimonadota bacterium]
MSNSPQIQKFIEFFTSNASGVLGTITNQSIDFTALEFGNFNFETIQSSIEIPCVVLSIMYSGSQTFQLQLMFDKSSVAILADLMMLGEGDTNYIPEEHNDAMKEMCNQILGSMTGEFAGEGVNLSGTVGDIELTDMEIQQDFLVDHKMQTIQFTVVGKSFYSYILFDDQAINAINDSFQAQNEPAFDAPPSMSGSARQEEPVKVSRAQFSEFEEVRPSSGKNINIDVLLDVVLPVSVELGRKDMKIKEILEIGQGSVVELNKLAGDLVDLMINGKKFAVGEVMVADENYAVRIVSLVSREERIKSLGQD